MLKLRIILAALLALAWLYTPAPTALAQDPPAQADGPAVARAKDFLQSVKIYADHYTPLVKAFMADLIGADFRLYVQPHLTQDGYFAGLRVVVTLSRETLDKFRGKDPAETALENLRDTLATAFPLFDDRCEILVRSGTAGASASASATVEVRPAVPEWFVNPPSAPGEAFYGVGTAAYKNPAMMQMALTSAQMAARRDLADCLSRVMQRLLAKDLALPSDRAGMGVTRSVLEFTLSGAEIAKTEYGAPDANGMTPAYCLARIGFDSAAENLHAHALAALQQAQPNAKLELADVKKLLKATQEALAKPALPPDEPLKPNIPDWFVNVPSEPGRAIYGVGTATYKNATAMQLALTASQQAARRQIADTVKVAIQAATKQFLKQALLPANQANAEGLMQDITRAATDFALSGAEIVKTEYGAPVQGMTPIYTLARLGFASMARNLHREISTRVKAIQPNAILDFDEVEKLLKDENERQLPAKPAPKDLPPLIE